MPVPIAVAPIFSTAIDSLAAVIFSMSLFM